MVETGAEHHSGFDDAELYHAGSQGILLIQERTQALVKMAGRATEERSRVLSSEMAGGEVVPDAGN